jgi:hypothetical protein
MLEVFTVGGGDYLVGTFNAIAAWTGSGGFKALIRVCMVMGLIYALLITAMDLDWRAWFRWFVQSTLIYLVLMVPTVTVKVTDRVNPGLAPATVANVPIGLAAMASFTSQVSDYLIAALRALGLVRCSRRIPASVSPITRRPSRACGATSPSRPCFQAMAALWRVIVLSARPALASAAR